MRFRSLIFWLHLIAGLIAGAVVLIMSVTGAALAFEKEIIAWAERDVRRVALLSADAQRLSLDELLSRVREVKPGERPSGITLDADPEAAVLISFGRTNAFYVNPYTGEARPQGAARVRAFMRLMVDWHRYLGGHDERRALGKAVTGACNAAFLFLAASGLYLWWPRHWTRQGLRAAGLMSFKLSGKARDWNWHNAVGFWTAPVLIVLTATAMPISYRWAGDLIYKLTGSTSPAPSGPGGASALAVDVPTPPAGVEPLAMEALFAVAQKEFPRWKQIGQRAGSAGGRGPRNVTAGALPVEAAERRSPPPVTLAITEQGQWPLFASTQLTLDPFTGAVLRQEGFRDFNRGRQVRSWTRFLHTGEALGAIGKAVAGLASLGATLLIWTGFALAWRRFFPRRSRGDAPLP